MNARVEELEKWMAAKEGEHFEFKEAKNRCDFEELCQYCTALANEGGGRILLGVTNLRPRQVVGSTAFDQPERTRNGLIERLHLRIDFEEIHHPNGRVLVFEIPSRPIGVPVQDKGIYWMRSGDSLLAMSEDRLRAIFAESGHDFSAEVCEAASLSDLDPDAIHKFRQQWIAKSGNRSLASLTDEQLLADIEAAIDGKPTYAALVLFGNRRALGIHLGQAEVVFEYRSSDASGPAQDRKEYRQAFFSFYDELWTTINLRNDKQAYQEGLFVLDILTFAERSVREAILNAVSHRNYQLSGSVFIRQYARRLEIVSPGGFPTGIGLENVLDRQSPRNRRIADIFSRCGLVERSGQGVNLMFEECIREGKPVPDFTGTDQYQVAVTLHGTVQDPHFVRYLERIGKERLATFNTHEFLILNLLSRDETIPDQYRERLPYLLDQGVIERISRQKYILSREFYDFSHRRGIYTRKRGLDRETNKALLLKHIEDNQADGSPLQDLLEVLPSLSREQVKTLLRELKAAGKAHTRGATRAGLWYPGEPHRWPDADTTKG
jgi:ATP-dependent DNA helicase RecG